MKPINIRKQGSEAAGKSGFARRVLLILISVVVVFAVGAFGLIRQRIGDSDNSKEGTGLFAVKRGDLAISVTESGSIKAVKAEDIKSEVEGRATIVNIVPEGTFITPEDVNDRKVLVELDSSNLKEQLSQREIELTSAEANHADANESHLIQIKQNESDVTAAELKVKFSLMDLQKYLGKTVAQRVVAGVGADPNSSINVASLLEDPNSLGGEASQKLRELTGNISLAKSDLEKAAYTLDWTKKLFEKQYVAETELKRDTLDHQRLVIEEEKARIALTLFQLYEFAKQTEQLLSDYKEAQRELDRTEARARAQLAQAKARLASASSTFQVQKQRLDKLEKQIVACMIRAPAVGQVVYWSSTQRWSRVKIEQGAEVPEGYKIITIPDASEMKVEVKIHETWIDRIEPNQPAEITVEAFPDKSFTGKVLKKAPLADTEDWLNPDLKVYSTDVGIDGTHDALKTGMTGKVTIIIDKLQDVLYVPIQCVVTVEDKKICHVAGSPAQKRDVETGLFNDNFVEIKGGLAEGEKVLLDPPKWTEPEKTEEQAETESDSAKEPAEGKPEPAKEPAEGKPEPAKEPAGGKPEPAKEQAEGKSEPAKEQAQTGSEPAKEQKKEEAQTKQASEK
ncbi:MAG: efflux RND transporter periplasmic adaptor subunit [Planctomycetota bacterium]|jgi:HlyD family secretion protein